MIDIATRRNQTLAVFGLGGSGLAAARALAASGARVAAWDDSETGRRNAVSAGVTLVDLYAADWRGFDGLVLAPGVPYTHKPHAVVRLAQAAGCPIIGDVELLVEACAGASFIGITGTNGKSTTTALIGHILQSAGRDVRVGGNLGPPALGFAPPEAGTVFVLELSSYQLDLTRRATFDIAALINVSPDHLDRHGDMEGYVAAKSRIFRDRPNGGQTAVIGVDDEHGRAIVSMLAGRPGWSVIPVAVGRALERGVFALDGALFDATNGPAKRAANLTGIPTLLGTHNWQNAAIAWAVAKTAGIAPARIADGIASYPGLPHRIETVATINAVRYVNDSKATNADATIRALACFDDIYWIAGGLPKEGGLAGVEAFLPRVRRAFLIGKAEADFARFLDGRVPVARCGDLKTALAEAHAQAQAEKIPGAAVLLSPACASFDQWKNFEARGDGFRDMVRALLREKAS